MLIQESDRVLVAVSGGVDSMVLLQLLARLGRTLPLKIFVAHLNYGLRGKDSDADERLVRDVCKNLELECFVKRMRPPRGKNLQDAARDIRYKFFESTAKKIGAGAVATAHHMDDQAETILLHLIRGSGISGLSGMRPKSRRGAITIIRPFLFATKGEITAHAKGRGVKYRDDATNLTSKYLRNVIRHELLPLLIKQNPRVVENLAALAERAFIDDQTLELTAMEAARQLTLERKGGRVILNRREYPHLPEGLRRRVLKIAFEHATGTRKDLNSDQIARMDEIALSPKNDASYQLPADCKFRRKGPYLIFTS